MNKTLKTTLVLLLVIVIVSLSACAGKQAESTSSPATNTGTAAYKVRIAYSPALCHAPLHVAIEKGLFAEEGLEFEAIPLDSSATLDAAASDTVDAGFGLVGKFAQPLENGLGIKLTAGVHSGCIKVVTKGDSPISQVADLKGKKIGVASLTDSPTIIVKRALADAGLSVEPGNEDAEIVVFPNADLPNALQTGAIDAYAALDPAVSIAEKENNLKVLVNTAIDAPFQDEFCCATFVTDKFAEENPELAKKYTDAVIKAAQWIAENPEEAANLQIEKKYVAGNAAFNGALLKTYSFHADVDGGSETLAKTLDVMKELGFLKSDTDTDVLAERSFLKF